MVFTFGGTMRFWISHEKPPIEKFKNTLFLLAEANAVTGLTLLLAGADDNALTALLVLNVAFLLSLRQLGASRRQGSNFLSDLWCNLTNSLPDAIAECLDNEFRNVINGGDHIQSALFKK